ncbi:hypothetical protein BLOT_011525 [Blomia tropicalis]|nr:hypothetical protein BLOT_011525 [Blomia tropicalis]
MLCFCLLWKRSSTLPPIIGTTFIVGIRNHPGTCRRQHRRQPSPAADNQVHPLRTDNNTRVLGSIIRLKFAKQFVSTPEYPSFTLLHLLLVFHMYVSNLHHDRSI